MKERERGIWFRVLLPLVLAVGGFWWWLQAGILADDVIYHREFDEDAAWSYRFISGQGAEIESWGQVFSSFGRHYLYWGNGRLGALLNFMMSMWGSWVSQILSSFALACMGVGLLRLSLGREWWERPGISMVLVWLMWLCLPWSESMLSMSFAINYVWGGALALWFLVWLREGRVKTWVMCVYAPPVALMHEGISVVVDLVLLYVCVYLLVKEKKWEGRIMWPSVVFGLASLAVIVSPAVLLRYSVVKDNMGWMAPGYMLRFLLMDAYMLAVATLALILLWRKGRRVQPWGVAMLLGVWSGIWIIYKCNFEMMRSMWMCLLLGIVIVGWALQMIKVCKWGGGAAWVMLAGMGVWMGLVGVYIRKGREDVDYFKEEYLRQGSPLLVKSDFMATVDVPWWTLAIPFSVQQEYFFQFLPLWENELKGRYEKEQGDLPLFPVYMRERVSLEELPALEGMEDVNIICGNLISGREIKGDMVLEMEADPREGSASLSPLAWVRWIASGGKERVRVKVPYSKHKIVVTPRLRWFAGEGVDTLYVGQVLYNRIPTYIRGLKFVEVEKKQ